METEHSDPIVVVFGSNRDGQAGIGMGDDENILLPRSVHFTRDYQVII
jgi:hypothetical protein